MNKIKVDTSWTLFLDRDGVLNEKIEGGYVSHPNELILLPGVLDAFPKLARAFGIIVIVTNQQGIGKGLMTEEDLSKVHEALLNKINASGGRVDKVYFAPQLQKENSPFRKPNTGMGQKAKEDFPQIDFSKSIMVGDSKTDMQFAEKLGMKRVFIGKGNALAHYCFNSLAAFAESLA